MSRVERRRWGFVIVWTAIIYATLPIARRLADKIEAAGYKWTLYHGPIAFVAIALVVALIYIFKRPHSHRLLRVFLMTIVACLYALFLKYLGKIPIERIHLLEYGILAILAKRASENRLKNLGACLLSAVLVAIVGLGDELIQGVLPDRFFDWRDVMTNALSGVLGLLLWVCISNKQRTLSHQN